MRLALICLIAFALAGCGDPLKKVQRLDQVEVAEGAGQADVLAPADGAEGAVAMAPEPEAPKRGLLGFLKRKADEGSAEPATEPNAVDGEPAEAAPVESAEAAEPEQEIAMAAPEAAPRRGLFGRVRAGRNDTAAGGRPSATARGPDRGAPDFQQVAFGASVPYGQMARVCGVPDRQLGKRAGGYPERGAKYTLYDSAPGGTGPRNFYLTGFKDGCARQFTAALVLFGSPESYEQIHYGPAGQSQPKSDTDAAYEQVKSRVCRVGKGKPCGSAMSRLARDTVFVSVYERFDSNPRWKNILLHDGEVLAMDMK